VQTRQSLAKAREAAKRLRHRRGLQAAFRVESRPHAQRLAPRVELIDLIALDAADLQSEAVRAEIDYGQCGRRHEERKGIDAARQRSRIHVSLALSLRCNMSAANFQIPLPSATLQRPIAK